jgi:hypothetical protein
MERQLIVRELQRQRVIAISGHTPKSVPRSHDPSVPNKEAHASHLISSKRSKDVEETKKPDMVENSEDLSLRKRVLISKKTQKTPQIDSEQEQPIGETLLPDTPARVDENPPEPKNVKDRDISIKEPDFKAKDSVFEGKIVRKTLTPQARDSGLIHTEIKSRKRTDILPEAEDGDQAKENTGSPARTSPNNDKKKKHDDISWV